MTTLNVSDIQHFSTGDGPGIRTTVFLKGCNLHCPWCHNPETISSKPLTLPFPKANRTVHYGRNMTVEEILADVMADKDFYISGGGITVSGGEPMLQAEGVAALAKAIREAGVSVLIDTAGNVPWSHFETVLPYVDIFYFDWKSGDEETYAKIIGGDFSRIYDNLCRLMKTDKSVHARIPLIPGINTDDDMANRMVCQLKEAGVKDVDLLPFHRLGSSKYEAMGLTYAYRDTTPLAKETVAHIQSIYAPHFNVTVEK